MKLTQFLVLSLGLTLGLACANEEQGAEDVTYSGVYFAHGLTSTETEDGLVVTGWYDAEKTETVGDLDDNMCYAASAANLLAWWQNGDSAAAGSTSQSLSYIWDTFVRNNRFQDDGGSTHEAINWWLTGVYAPVEQVGDSWKWLDAGEPEWERYYTAYEDLNAGASDGDDVMSMTLPNCKKDGEDFFGYYYDQYGLTQQNLANFLIDVWAYDDSAEASAAGIADAGSAEEEDGVDSISDVDFVEILRESAISLGVLSETADSELDDEVIAHALTLWGVEYDGDGNLTEIWLTDSDDYENQLFAVSVTLDEEAGKIYLGEQNDEGVFESDYGNNVYIAGIYALNMEEARTWTLVPEPTTATLSLVALAAMAMRRRRK